jgi:UDP-4-amino-4,6-dideoxy-N-acetyl-beta-L-altrosamine transaminase
MKAIPYGKQEITQQDIEVVIDALKSDFLTQGPQIAAFEKEFANYIGCKYAVAVSNGTAALHLAAMALGVSSNSKVITTPITFAASANCIAYCGGSVEFVDIDPSTFTIDLNKLEILLKTKPVGTYQGIVPVDFAGYPVDLERLRAIANKYHLWILEDACHAPGGSFIDSAGTDQRCGNGKFAEMAIFSFHPVKHIATGEGGMITTNDEKLFKQLLILRTHGITKDPDLLIENHGGWYYEMQSLGYNYRITDFQAALGSSQLKRAPAGIQKRQKLAQRYYDGLKNSPLILPAVKNEINHAWHLYVVQTERRLELYNYLHAKNVKVQVHYIPVHTMPYYKALGWTHGDFPVSEKFYSMCLSLPMYPSLTVEDQDYVIKSINDFFA